MKTNTLSSKYIRTIGHLGHYVQPREKNDLLF